MRKPEPILPGRIRQIRQCTFGWIDHNFLHCGYLNSLSHAELLLYYFLVTVADRHGVSFYDYGRICQLLNLETDSYLNARDQLCKLSLIAYRNSVFQVLPLPENSQPVSPSSVPMRPSQTQELQTIRTLISNLTS